MKTKTKQELLTAYLDSERSLEYAKAELEALEGKRDELKAAVTSNVKLHEVLSTTGVRTLSDEFVFLEGSDIQVSKFEPIPTLWDLKDE
ncbi:coil containing protein [Vibrio phage 1.184.A._10N.286.49.A5]|nr:coil containing protein [Vibrio phage 1.184.A._10N.286.49.A5]